MVYQVLVLIVVERTGCEDTVEVMCSAVRFLSLECTARLVCIIFCSALQRSWLGFSQGDDTLQQSLSLEAMIYDNDQGYFGGLSQDFFF